MNSRRAFLGFAIALPVFGSVLRPALASTAEVFNSSGIAIHGYDPVGYFTQNKPVDGNDAFRLRWMGVNWRFSNEENMTAFEANPWAYAPHFGGYCAYAMSKGAIANSVPEAWTIHEDRLYLNFSTGVRDIWRRDIPGYIAAAEKVWPGILNA